jgi:hypothetical protein
MSVPVFSKGVWRLIPLPVPVDPRWTQSDRFLYASVYAALQRKGVADETIGIIAEAYLYKKLCPQLRYPSSIETFLDLVGKA